MSCTRTLAPVAKKIGKLPVVVERDASAPFNHTSQRKRQTRRYVIQGRELFITYPSPPTEDEQCELMKLKALACSCCTAEEMKRQECHAVWLSAKLKHKFELPFTPNLISAVIPPELVERGREHNDWRGAIQIHQHAFITCKACHVSHKRGSTNVPKLIPNVKLGGSFFGNPFYDFPLKQSRALFEYYVDSNFRQLENGELEQILVANAPA